MILLPNANNMLSAFISSCYNRNFLVCNRNKLNIGHLNNLRHNRLYIEYYRRIVLYFYKLFPLLPFNKSEEDCQTN